MILFKTYKHFFPEIVHVLTGSSYSPRRTRNFNSNSWNSVMLQLRIRSCIDEAELNDFPKLNSSNCCNDVTGPPPITSDHKRLHWVGNSWFLEWEISWEQRKRKQAKKSSPLCFRWKIINARDHMSNETSVARLRLDVGRLSEPLIT